MMSGYSFLTRSSSHSFHDGGGGAAVWHMLLMSIDLGSQDDFSLTLVGWFFKRDLACLILILQSACPQFTQYIFTWYLGCCTYNRRPLFIFGTCHLLRTLSILPLTYFLYVSLTGVSDILLVPICLSFTLFPGCLRSSDYFLTPLLL